MKSEIPTTTPKDMDYPIISLRRFAMCIHSEYNLPPNFKSLTIVYVFNVT